MSAPDKTAQSAPYRGPVPAQSSGAALFGGPVGPVARDAVPPPEVQRPAAVDYTAIRDSADFAELRGRLLRFTLPATALFMANFMLFVLLSAYVPAFMATPAIGLINVGLLIGVFQFVTTVLIVVLYGRYARTHVDPVAEHIRDEVEGP